MEAVPQEQIDQILGTQEKSDTENIDKTIDTDLSNAPVGTGNNQIAIQKLHATEKTSHSLKVASRKSKRSNPLRVRLLYSADSPHVKECITPMIEISDDALGDGRIATRQKLLKLIAEA